MPKRLRKLIAKKNKKLCILYFEPLLLVTSFSLSSSFKIEIGDHLS
jgi:hypothetical protein